MKHRKCWSKSIGERGARVRLYEDRAGGPLSRSVYIKGKEKRKRERAARAVFVQPHSRPAFADRLRPAFPVFHTFLRSLAMSWASAPGSYGPVGGAASFWRSPRRTR